ncbi:hypothetical protein WMF31_11480 [Sorangium sp. So ce1036]|uniref:hypothetical protein n=1 Tax=Sorangium sp. So ce1036 TaxID=3133328 RepID=UPI003F0054B2
MPQNEESVTACRSDIDIVLGGTNDYRGLLDPLSNFTGWHLSTNGGATVRNEGRLPTVTVGGIDLPSGGDPVDVADGDCQLFAGSLNYDPVDPFNNLNAIGVYRSDPATLARCPGGSDPSCWPVRRAVAVSRPGHFLDKEWIDVGVSGDAGKVVWAVYADFAVDESAPLGFTSASIYAVRCDADLESCTEPILISGDDQDVQFGDVTIGPDGRVYITWTEILGELEGTPQTFIHKLRIAPAGSTDFGDEQVVYEERQAIPFGGSLHANDFRVATYPKHAVRKTDCGGTRVFVVWDACAVRLLGEMSCQEPQIKLVYSDDDGRHWSDVKILSVEGDNYFPTIADDPLGSSLALAWFTNRHDTRFHNRQDVELVSVDPSSGEVTRRQRITGISNEPEADPLLGGSFIGDYIEVFAHREAAYVHYNANYRQVQLLGEGFRIPQQDNFLARRRLDH